MGLIRLEELHESLIRRIADFDGVAGTAVLDLGSGELVSVNADLSLPAASTIKIHILAALHQLDAQGDSDLNERVSVTDRVTGSPVLGYLEDPVELSWRDLANLMIMVSDNTATNLILEEIGFERMEAFLRTWGLASTAVRRKMKDFAAARRGEENVTTPSDLTFMLRQLWSGQAFHPGVANACLGVLRKPKKSHFRNAFPQGTLMANKPGELPGVLCEVALLDLAGSSIVFSLMSESGMSDVREHVRWFEETARMAFELMT